ncbi:MAG: hypothetical protein EAZ92_01135 [Candidatus Kapaibacterium sp.]|nr:MAG: hypothetical protein EAZ92_01135 [Candidatus Kapabacteria bacterium]
MKFLKLLAFVLSAQTTHLFQFKNTFSVIGRVLFAGVVLLYAVGFGMLFHYADRLETSTETILNAINTAIAVMTLTKSFFPSFHPASQALVAFHPASRFTRAFLGICIDALSLFPLMMLVLYGIIFAIAGTVLTPVQMLLALVFFATAILLDRSLRLLVEYNVPCRWLLVACVLVLAGLLVGRIAVPSEFRPAQAVFVPLLFVASAGIQLFLALESVKPITERISGNSVAVPSIHAASTTLPYTLKAFFGAKHVRTMLLMALGLKIMMLVFFVKGGSKNPAQTWSKFHINFEWMFLAPIAWFTYALNNSYGMNWQLWQTNELHNTQRRIILQPSLLLYFRHALLALALDAVLTVSALALGKMFAWKYLVCWLAAALSFLALGVFVTCTQPIKVEKLTSSIFVSMRQVSSSLGMALVFAIMLAISFLSFTTAWYAFAVPLVVVPISAFFVLQYSTLKYNLYNGIHH